jgi:Lon protease-like protein
VSDEFELQPVFPLPNVVLFPRAILPLHIFEPRYRTMIADVLGGGQTVVITLLKQGWEQDYYESPEAHSAGCLGRVVQHHKLPDGRYNIMLHGESKVFLDRFERQQPYRIARVRRVEEDLSWACGDAAPAMAAELVELFRRAHQRQGTALDLVQLLGPHVSPEAVVNTIAMNLDGEPEVRQQLLELDRLELRFRALHQHLRESSRTQDVIDRVRRLYPKDARRN